MLYLFRCDYPISRVYLLSSILYRCVSNAMKRRLGKGKQNFAKERNFDESLVKSTEVKKREGKEFLYEGEDVEEPLHQIELKNPTFREEEVNTEAKENLGQTEESSHFKYPFKFAILFFIVSVAAVTGLILYYKSHQHMAMHK